MSGFRLPGVRCPNCGAQLRARNSRPLSTKVREIFYACTGDVQCGLTCRAELVITHAISPPGLARPSFDLPYLKPRPANDHDPDAGASSLA